MKPKQSNKNDSHFGLYYHIPFCSYICHYCDFAKTARHDEGLRQKYIVDLMNHTNLWFAHPDIHDKQQFTSVFFGGGTPGIFGKELESLFDIFTPRLSPGAEVSLETNPDNITPTRLREWQELGVTRVSVGVQSFQEKGLKFLTRPDQVSKVIDEVIALRSAFQNMNIDLIYGWPGQTTSMWEDDLRLAVDLGVPHISLYTLIYEPGIVIGRREARGLISQTEDSYLADLYKFACDFLKESGYVHEEVSNWSKPGFSCRHNWLYWKGNSWLGIGAGAHGYLAELGDYGQRYAYGKNLKRLTKGQNNGFEAVNIEWENRDKTAWLLEQITCGLRCSNGIDTAFLASNTGLRFEPRAAVLRGLKEKSLVEYEQNRLKLAPHEWFRETAWSLEVSMSFV